MKFVQSALAAASVAYVASAAAFSTVAQVSTDGYFGDETFQRAFLQGLQGDTTNTETDCLHGYDSMRILWSDVKDVFEDISYYTDALIAKGQGNGTDAGYAMEKFERMVDLATGMTDVYNECKIDLYMQSVSKSIQNLSGFINQVINVFFRSQDDTLLTNLETALAA